jgi:hypothetical protein
MLIYCFEPVGLPFEAAVPAFVHTVASEQVPLTLLGCAEKPALDDLGAATSSRLEIGAVSHGVPVEQSGRVAIPIHCSTEDPSLMAVAGEITLTRLSPTLCHLSLSSSITGRLGAGLMYNRSFQMAVELAIAGFLERLAMLVLAVRIREPQS